MSDNVVPTAIEHMNVSQLEHDFSNSVASVAGAASTIIEFRNRLDGPTIDSLAAVIRDQARRMEAVFHAMTRMAVPPDVVDLRDPAANHFG